MEKAKENVGKSGKLDKIGKKDYNLGKLTKKI